MKFQLRKCTQCENYTLKLTCSRCQIDTKIAHPAKFSPDDKYLKYRIIDNYN